MALTRNAALQILGLSSGASEDEIKKAYRKMAMKYHPDRNKGADAAAQMQRVNEAYAALTDPLKQKFSKSDFDGFNWTPPPKKQGEKILFTSHIPVSLNEAFNGTHKVVNFAALGSTNFTIVIPRGFVPNSRLKIISSTTAEGNEVVVDTRVTIETGEWNVKWAIEPNLYGGGIEGSGDMEKTIYVDWTTMLKGGVFMFDTIDGSTLQLRIIPGIEAGTRLKVKGRGYWKDSNCSARGDVFLRVMPKAQKLEDMPLEELEALHKEIKNAIVKKRDPFHDAAKKEHFV